VDPEMVTGGTFGGDGETDRRVRSLAMTVPKSPIQLPEFQRTYYLLSSGNSSVNRMLKL